MGGPTLEKVLVTYIYEDGVWSAETKDFGIGYCHSDLKVARKVITESVKFFYEDIDTEIELVEVIPRAQNQSVI